MSHSKDVLQPEPLLLGNPDNRSRGVKSAIYRNQDPKQSKIYSTSNKNLDERITNQLKKIGPGQISKKPSQSRLAQQKHVHTTSSGQYIQQYGQNHGSNPQIKERLQQLTQKINLIEYRQRKMNSRSRYSVGKQVSAKKQPKTIKITASETADASKIVIQELKTVKDQILSLKLMVGGIRHSNGTLAENARSISKIKYSSDKPSEMSTLVNSNNRGKRSEIYEQNQYMQEKNQYNQRQDLQQKRTVFYNPSTSSITGNVIPQTSLVQSRELTLKPTVSTSLHKGKPQISNSVSSMPRGLSNKRFRVSNTASKKQLHVPLSKEQLRRKSMSQMSKYPITRRAPQIDIITGIEQTFQKEDLNKKALILPKLPEGFNPVLNSEELMNLAKQLMTSFNVDSDYSEPINIKKYKNCVFFNHLNTNILWHYDNKFYIGGWCQDGEGHKQGYGVEYIPQKYMYQGQFLKGKRHGFGSMSSLTGQYYKGSWVNGYRHGKGRLEETSGVIYDGNWVHGKKQGFGKMKFSNKEYYEGLFKSGQKEGLGKQIFKNGDAYQGDYRLGKFQGFGIYRWANGSSYDGQFTQGKRQGRGTWISNNSKNPDIYQGQYQNDKKCGKGKYKWANGSVYIGSFLNDVKDGEGTIHYNDGKVLHGIWQEDEITKRLYLQKPKLSKVKK